MLQGVYIFSRKYAVVYLLQYEHVLDPNYAVVHSRKMLQYRNSPSQIIPLSLIRPRISGSSPPPYLFKLPPTIPLIFDFQINK